MPPTKLEQARNGLTHSLGVQKPLRDRATRRMKARHAGQKKAERQASAAHERADKLNSEGHLDKGRGVAKRARQLEVKAGREEARAIFWKGRARALTQRIDGITTKLADVEADIRKWEETHGPHVSPRNRNKVVGGTDGENFIFAAKRSVANCSARKRINHYSMYSPGFNVQHTLEPGPGYSERDDCSLYVTGLCWTAGLPDPNGQNWKAGFTGTILGQHNGWKIVSEAEMRKRGWGIVVYVSSWSDMTGHHTEAYIGEGGTLTAGHGDAAVNYGSINLFGDGMYRCLVLDR